VVVLGEHPSALAAAGAGCVLAGLAVLALPGPRRGDAADALPGRRGGAADALPAPAAPDAATLHGLPPVGG
jgi:hypothetical protein